MLDKDDRKVIKESKNAGAVLVTLDRVLREEAKGLTPQEVLAKAETEGKGTPEAMANISHLRQLTPRDLTVLAEKGNETSKLFERYISISKEQAHLVRQLRVEKNFSWRAVARYHSIVWSGPWGGNQIAGMVICEKAALLLGEDFMKPPWN